MICPHCHSVRCRRSRRRTVPDYLFSVVGLRPWRCRTCESRFHARLVPVKFQRWAHCPRCGNLHLEIISRERIHGFFPRLLATFGAPAYRCDPCRHRFVALRPKCRQLPRRHAEETDAADESEEPHASEPRAASGA